MAWKDWPYWLRGGVIAVPIYWIVFIVAYFLIDRFAPKGWAGIGYAAILILLMLPGFLVGQYMETSLIGSTFTRELVIVVIQTITAFVIGAVIGIIVKHVKAQK